MNLENILFHLKEAKEELDRTIKKIEKDHDYNEAEFVVAMSHLYHHLNTSWNSRNANKKVVRECSENNFKKWRKFPKNDELFLEM